MKNKERKLTVKENKFAAARAQDSTNLEAYEKAGYSMNSNKNTLQTAASNINTRPEVQKAIEAALTKHGLTPESAVGELAKIVAQDEEMGAKRLAIKDSLELMGWSKTERPNMHVEFKGNFFGMSRDIRKPNVIESEEPTFSAEVIDGDE